MNDTNWDDLRLFLAVARAGGLHAAAATTGKSAPTLGRRMLALERRMGRDLFHRLPRGYALTEDGETLLAEVTDVETRVLPLVERDTVPTVKVSAGTWTTHVLASAVPQILGDTPIRLRFLTAEEKLDIGRREAVIGVRNARPTEPGLAGQRIGRIRFAVYATDPNVETWARVLGVAPSAAWVADQSGPAIDVSHPRTALDLALAGHARAVLPTFIGDVKPDLARQGAPIATLDHDQWLVTHHEDRHLPEVRRVITRVRDVLRASTAA